MFNNDNLIEYKSDKLFISLGNYCLTSMLLKENNIKDNYSNINNLTKNNFYFNEINKVFGNSIVVDHQHHNLLEDNDYNYLKRCVQRFNSLNELNKELIFIMIQPIYLNIDVVDYNENKDKILNLYNNLCNKFNNNIKLIIFIIQHKKNNIFKEEIINLNLKIIELDTEMNVGNHGMMYFDENGLKKFLQIIHS